MTRVHEITTGMGRTYVLDFSCGQYTVANTTDGKYEAVQYYRTEEAGLKFLNTLKRRQTKKSSVYRTGETPARGDTVRADKTPAWPEGRVGTLIQVFSADHPINPSRALVRWLERPVRSTRMARIDPGKLSLIEPASAKAGAA